jgi:hypothetical protein
MEIELTAMHNMINTIYAKRLQLESLLEELHDVKLTALKTEAAALAMKMKSWDNDMVQRKTKVYDDAENFPAKFTVNYLFLINQTESDLPRVNQPSMDRMSELNAQWAVLKGRGLEILEKDLPALNKKLWEAGIGAVWKD